ncbi:gamma-glutamyl-gamma-aminobutyrate hydrolase family protein [Acuticoccus mangrovi]|uniref:gamma-glutamyl-gamma-aminobutyrate hydrolase n=1 Tax=Acuticoccus mangrovi TaxID=2796142 RepID=A0A934IQ68_9HYPH|nr:gamma-glutamyl-gamma-aminobutyrate hydrolase family protein [Acuticoccus mangrovi]
MVQPMVIASCDAIVHNGLAWSGGPSTYLSAVALAGCLPVQLPTITTPIDPTALLDAASGVLLTGARSNVHPSLYGAAETEEAGPFDPDRDRTVLPLIRAALDRKLPLLCICRGLQELNVALGGTLHVAVHEVPGRDDHRGPSDSDMDARFALRHTVAPAPGGRLAAILGDAEVKVNSVHRQAIDRLADGLEVEARAPDGTIEAVSVRGAGFALGVQWHPEYFVASDGPSAAVFDAFADAVRAHARGARPARAA